MSNALKRLEQKVDLISNPLFWHGFSAITCFTITYALSGQKRSLLFYTLLAVLSFVLLGVGGLAGFVAAFALRYKAALRA